MSDELKDIRYETFSSDEVRALTDEEVLADPDAMHNLLLMHALWEARGYPPLEGTQLDRIVRKHRKDSKCS